MINKGKLFEKWLEKGKKEFSKLNPRERRLSILVIFVCVLAWADSMWMTPAFDRAAKSRKNVESLKQDLDAAKKRFVAAAGEISDDNLAVLKKKVEDQKVKLEQSKNNIQTISRQQGIALLSNLGVVGKGKIIKLGVDASKSLTPEVWEHKIVMEISGDWDDTVEVLENVTKMSSFISPESFQVSRNEGKLKTTVEWSIVSKDKEWGATNE